MSAEQLGAACHINFPRYVVLPNGDLVSMVFRRPRLLRPCVRGKYLGFTLLDRAGELQPIYQHRLVAETFHGAAPADHEVRHRDGTKSNNAASNLCWGTRSQNMRDKELHGTAPIGEAHPMAKLDEARVRMIRKLHRWGFAAGALMKYFGISRMTYWRVVNRRSWSHVV